jgi:hypothetical protein
MTVALADETVTKITSEVILVDFDGSKTDRLGASETFSGVSTSSVLPTGQAGDLGISSTSISTTTLQVKLIDGRSPISATANSTTGVFTAVAHGITDGSRIHLIGCNLPAPLDADTEYFVRDGTADTFKLADCADGPALGLTSAGSDVKVGIDYLVSVSASTSAGQVVSMAGRCAVRV